ncbi:reprolysin-like metallopeptidase [Dokdonia pacifica]|uniref:Por secretion system C-terminal sorting domain-containing protein n=1 Tax=Dokdonia pacifica TaxID=1627892 RepID=A0A238W5S2_9FLAO|nr:zinc-dependent metalloprotease family protein [Dokdonia pacifica]SNR41902.1 Por secretion system C-terminal sorting domain-containing protein [Dokdonia pacifica]
MKKTLLTLIFLLCIQTIAFSQNQANPWLETSETRTNSMNKEYRNFTPNHYNLYSLNIDQLQQRINTVPLRDSNVVSDVIVSFPTINGKIENFRIYEAPVLDEALTERYPSIRSYLGQHIKNTSTVIRFSVSNNGVHGMITSGSHKTVYIDPYTENKEFYMAYSREDIPDNAFANEFFECRADDIITTPLENNEALPARNADDSTLRTYRLAVVCTGEYSAYHLNNQGIDPDANDEEKKEAVLSAINTSMTRVNGIFERDLALTMVVIDNNTDIIFLDPATDGLTNNDPFELLEESQDICDDVIGNPNYDIGHVFSTQGGGVAFLNSPCVTGLKAQGVTGINNPIGDFFNVDYVAHEMGHQFGGNHPQNNNCQRTSVSIETGSGSSIMGYAGICAPNVQNNSDDYFNGVSIAEMWNNISAGASSSCPEMSSTENQAPIITPTENFMIPISTPFVLKGNATDPEENEITYCWEQIDATPAPMPPSPTSANGPLFRTLDPTVNADRYMPALSTVVAGDLGSTWEQLPSVSRSMSFRLTIRDNATIGGATASEDMTVTSTDSAGPFIVTSQATNESWDLNTTQTITWDVANTDAAPINEAAVNIFLSTDGGETFPTQLATNVPNNGSTSIVVPSSLDPTTEARVLVMGVVSPFYQINTANFTITDVLGISDLDSSNFELFPNPTTGIVDIRFTSSSNKVSIVLYDLAGRKISEETEETITNAPFTKTLNYQYLPKGIYFMKISDGDLISTQRLIKK